MARYLALPLIALLAACQNVAPETAAFAPPPEPPTVADPAPLAPVRATEVRDRTALERLRGNAGLTLQWIGWEKRGLLEVSQRGDVVHVKGAQVAPDGKGRVEVEGDILSIDANHFILRGTIAITDTPDNGRRCVKQGDSEFAITQGRKYWRMREFEWCDELTDYVDIYF
ncbi:MAG TPA: hypothetical protein VGN36_07640 [Sphingorhabdus sp.]|nr:hypothetical protein [Sphingorhabdus sp.]